jgi:PII-like signaling protein
VAAAVTGARGAGRGEMEGDAMPVPEKAALLRIYTEERARNGSKPLYEAIVLEAREQGLAGATVLRGPMGYGESHRIHNASILDLSGNLPLVIEIVDAEDKLRIFVTSLGEMRDIGLVTLERVEVLHYGKATGR